MKITLVNNLNWHKYLDDYGWNKLPLGWRKRLKSKDKNYDKHLRLLHELLVSAMKCKQTVDSQNVDKGLKSLDKFVNVYFDDHGQEHLKEMSE